jgi:hypothetical protein
VAQPSGREFPRRRALGAGTATRTFAKLAADVHPRRRLNPLTDWTSTDVAPPATVSMNCEQFAQATDRSPLSLREREPSKSLGGVSLLL